MFDQAWRVDSGSSESSGMASGQNDSGSGYKKPGLELPALPPVIFGAPIFIGALIHVLLWRSAVIGGTTGVVIGVVLVVAGIGLIFWSIKTLKAQGEHPEPGEPTETLVVTGPFKRTRNPIYSGFLLIAAGLAISLNAMAMLISVFFGSAALTALVIRREEAYLEREFGEIYTKYANRTGRWI
ncbi:MAG: isoprenylcysteine carboxylmethyltransferase family protein [Dehalococcoidia bacterium]|nr:isoprenylcysteine carboxylmethyltransferase family protein [Dehalococcoidia bacterium]